MDRYSVVHAGALGTNKVPRLPTMRHEPLSHSYAIFFVHEAYHHQGLSQYDTGVMLRTETRKWSSRVSFSFIFL
ncbi:hypothetical protein X946_3507 [Burkholderia sp. ABCPW 111]|nr:hypothetical protein X946_3507 [Burkholderia sp. ABCPW 111]